MKNTDLQTSEIMISDRDQLSGGSPLSPIQMASYTLENNTVQGNMQAQIFMTMPLQLNTQYSQAFEDAVEAVQQNSERGTVMANQAYEEYYNQNRGSANVTPPSRQEKKGKLRKLKIGGVEAL